MVNTTLCYIQKDEKYLMLHRVKKENDYNKDKWIGIGGKFENDESPFECVIREVQEETGLKLDENHLVYKGIVTFVCKKTIPENDFVEFMHLFWTDSFSGELKPDCNEGILEWIDKDKMNCLPHWKGDEIFLDLIDKKIPFFSLKLVYDEKGNLIFSKIEGKTEK